MITFEFNGTDIKNPLLSECGRFLVDPKYYGFSLYSTGGGCAALMKELQNGDYILLTDENGISADMSGDVLIGLYSDDGTEKECYFLKSNLSVGAHMIRKSVFNAMQNAEEMGGTDSAKDYINLMSVIIAECNQRIQNVLTHSEV